MSLLPDAKVLEELTELLALTRSSRAADVAVHAMAMKQTKGLAEQKRAQTLPAKHQTSAKSSEVLPLFTRDTEPISSQRTKTGTSRELRWELRGNGSHLPDILLYLLTLREKKLERDLSSQLKLERYLEVGF
jgi:hypothetical protein